MSRLAHFFVVHHPGRPWPAEEARHCLPDGAAWQLEEAGPLLVGWQGAPCAPQLIAQGDLCGPERSRLDSPAFASELSTGSTAAARELDGVFAVLAWDTSSGRAALVTDRFGLMPVYTHSRDGVTCYSTSLAVLLALARPSLEVAPESVSEMLVLQMVLGNRTFLRDVSLVGPASVVALGDGPPAVRTYWDWAGLGPTREPGPDVVRNTYALIEQAILRAVPPGVRKVALPLSGGLDSRLLAAVLARHGVPLQAYNIDFGREAAIARQVAHTLGVPLRGLGMLDRPESVPEAHTAFEGAYHANQVWGWEMIRRAAEEDGCDVFFDGLAFDGILGGTHRVTGNCVEKLARTLEGNYADIDEDSLATVAGEAAHGALFPQVRAGLAREAAEALRQAGPRASDYFLMNHRVRKYTFAYGLAHLRLLPGRFPYVSTRLFEHCQHLPAELRQEHNLYRRIYCELFPNLARIPWAKTGLPLDRYAAGKRSRWQDWLEAAVRRLSRGRWSLADRGDFNVLLRRRPDLLDVYRRVLEAESPGLAGVLPDGMVGRAVEQHQAGRSRGGLLQGLYTVKHFLALCAAARDESDRVHFANREADLTGPGRRASRDRSTEEACAN